MAKKRSDSIVKAPDDDWRTEGDLSTLMAAEAIKKDAKRYARVRALAKQRVVDVAAVAANDAD